MLLRLVLLGSLIGFFVTGLPGCAEGPLWRTGYLSPWARQKWEDDERIAVTLFSRRTELRHEVESAQAAGEIEQQRVAAKLGDLVARDPVGLIRIEATRLLADLPVPAAASALRLAARDREVAVRTAAVRSLGERGDADSARVLAELSRSDDNLDVRIAATSQLGNCPGDVAIQALSAAIGHPDPAMQLSAASALTRITGEDYGNDIQAWQQYLQARDASPENDSRVANEPTGGEFAR
jgi:HEAT repeat protein